MDSQQVPKKSIPTLCVEGKCFETNEEKANIFPNFFQSIVEPGDRPNAINPHDINELDALQENEMYSHLTINEPFTMSELNDALKIVKQSAPGKYGITYQIYQNLPDAAKLTLLKLYNMMWQTGDFPSECKHAILIPILKQGKASNEVSSYRPMALTPCFTNMTKVMEKIVDKRLQWYTQKNTISFPRSKMDSGKAEIPLITLFFFWKMTSKNP